MPLHIGPNGWQCKLRWRLTGDPEEVISTIGIRRLEGMNQTPSEIAQLVGEAWDGAWGSESLTTGWAFVGVDCLEGSENQDGETGTWNNVIAGGQATQCLPQNCALLVRKITSLGGPKGHGRMYLPAGYLFENMVSNTGVISNGDINGLNVRMAQFLGNIGDDSSPPLEEGLGSEPVLFHSDPTLPETTITAFAVQAVIATQRKRLRR